MYRQIVPEIIDKQKLITISPSATVRDACRLMAQHSIGAVLVLEDEKLIGIFTERDLLMRVTAQHLDPDTTHISGVMTADPDTVDINASTSGILNQMKEHGYRHLPITENGELIGIISVRDLYAAVKSELEHGIQQREAFIFGHYGAMSS